MQTTTDLKLQLVAPEHKSLKNVSVDKITSQIMTIEIAENVSAEGTLEK